MSKSKLLIESIRRRPGLYLGKKSLTKLYDFINGFKMACVLHQIEDEHLGLEIPEDFHDWVAYRTHFRESTSGWCNMIVATSGSEEQAFDRFFELLEEHSQRIPKLVAELIGPTSKTLIRRDGQEKVIPPPEKVQLATYTTDPGFFAIFNSPNWTDEFCPYLSWFSGLGGGEWVIHDQQAYNVLLQANKAWEREVNALIDEN